MTITQDPVARERLLGRLASTLESVLNEHPEGVDADALLRAVSRTNGQPLEFVTMALSRIDYKESVDDGLIRAVGNDG